MEDQLITFETAKLAEQKFTRKLGRDEIRGCIIYDENGNTEWGFNTGTVAYSQSLLQRKLREEYNCFVEVSLHGEENNDWIINPNNLMFEITIDYYGSDFQIEMTTSEDFYAYGFKSYEEALEKGLHEALLLIE